MNNGIMRQRADRGRVWKLVVVGLMAGAMMVGKQARAQQPVATAMPGKPALALGSFDVATLNYLVNEFGVAGEARSFRLVGEASTDGHWQAKADGTAPYRTRIVVLRPVDPRKFNGTVVVEWLNVSGGLDVPVDWTMLHREMVRKGYAYVGISAQKVGIEGGTSLGRGPAAPLKTVDPARYGQLAHPGDAYSFDIYSDVARLLRGKQQALILGGLVPKRLLAVGESQSAFFMATYVNAVDPLARAYDGFLVHSRSGAVAPIDGTSMMNGHLAFLRAPVRIRSDVRVPTMQVNTETDVMGLIGSIGFYAARQPDTAKVRTWEIAGAAHADNYLFRAGQIDDGHIDIEKLAEVWRPLDNIQGLKLPEPMNNGPQHHYVVEAALRQLEQWVRTGKAPPTATALDVNPGDHPTFVVDTLGLATGGVRTPWVDVPVGVLSGVGAGPMVPLVGVSRPFDAATLGKLYPGGRAEYLAKFTTALDGAIAGGYILPDDRDEIRELAGLGYHGAK
jgi:hypothetical protein